jgi:hypothetical protein
MVFRDARKFGDVFYSLQGFFLCLVFSTTTTTTTTNNNNNSFNVVTCLTTAGKPITGQKAQ